MLPYSKSGHVRRSPFFRAFSIARDHLARILAIVAAVLVILLAFHELSVTREYGPYLEMDALFDRRQPVSPAAIRHYAQRLDGAFKSCRTDIVDAVVSVSQQHVIEEAAENGPEARLVAMRRMEVVVRGALKCSPTNGDLWGRLATLRWFLGGDADEQLTLMSLSQSYAPADLAIIRRRLRHWSMVTPPMLALGDHLVRGDLRTILMHAPERDVVRVIGRLPPPLISLAADEAALVPPSRVAALRNAGLATLPN